MDLDLKGKTVTVTGGGSNIGRAISLDFAREGSNVSIGELDEKQTVRVIDEIKKKGGKATFTKCDVTDWEQFQNLVAKTKATFGDIDVLVNVVGFSVEGPFIQRTRQDWEKEVKVNYWSVINGVRAVLDHMIEKKKGAIVNISSDTGRNGDANVAVYSGAKGAVIAFSKSIAREVGRYGIRVNVVCPGMTVPTPEEIGDFSMWKTNIARYTPEIREKIVRLYPLRKMGVPDDIAHAVLFMASNRAAGHITGQTLSVSGGYTMV